MVLSHVDKSDPSTWKNETAVDDMRKEFSGWDPQSVIFLRPHDFATGKINLTFEL
jgi:salicylate hydroxylase